MEAFWCVGVLCDISSSKEMWAEKVPREPGVYILVIHVRRTITVKTGRRVFMLRPGYYLYVGSARGPGGLHARVARHARREKKVWWHIDRVTVSPHSQILRVLCLAARELPALSESIVSNCLAGKGLAPIPGFGSSDDPLAASHFFYTSRLGEALAASTSCLRRLVESLD